MDDDNYSTDERITRNRGDGIFASSKKIVTSPTKQEGSD